MQLTPNTCTQLCLLRVYTHEYTSRHKPTHTPHTHFYTTMDLTRLSSIAASIQQLLLPVTQLGAMLASPGKTSQRSASCYHRLESSCSTPLSNVTASVPASPACMVTKTGFILLLSFLSCKVFYLEQRVRLSRFWSTCIPSGAWLDFVVITSQIKFDKCSSLELLKSAVLAANELDVSQNTRREKLSGKL